MAVNQQGRRAGAVTVALDSWHLDIESFLELQTENGDQRGKAYDIYPQVVLSDIFMERVDKNLDWTLFDPYEIRQKYEVELCEIYGDEFRKIYEKIENDRTLTLRKTLKARELFKNILKVQIETGMPYIFFKDTANERNHNKHSGIITLTLRKTLKARELFKNILKVQIETGMPYIFFKDTANERNHNKHSGIIGNGNLCMESFSNFSPSKNFTENIEEGQGVRKVELGEVHTCNLVSMNLAEIEDSELEKIVGLAVRILDNTIDLTKTPIKESDKHNFSYRAIGVGTMGLADYLAKNNISYSKSIDVVDKLFEKIALYSIKSSSLLAKERGVYPMYKGSDWERGRFFQKDRDWYRKNSSFSSEWEEVFDTVKKYGIRNGELTAIAPNTSTSLLMGACASVNPTFSKFYIFDTVKKYGIRNGELTAIAPNTSTSLLMGACASVNPTFSKFYIEKNQKGAVPRVVKYLKEKNWFYQEFKNIEPETYIKIMSKIGKWTTQGVSMELIFDLNKNIRAKNINWFYQEFKNIEPETYIKIMSKIGKWTTQGVSMELIFDLNKNIRAKNIYDAFLTAWKEGCKSVYYIRTIQKNTNKINEKEECESCSG